FRATAKAEEFRLDFGEPLAISEVTVDGEETAYAREGKDLVVQHPVEEDGRYVLEIAYGGTPEPVPAPTARSDFSSSGWTITPDGETWTMQEPFGAYSWYAVNDHPSDKALYDFTLSVPSPMIGVANGELVSESDDAGVHVTEWHLAEPAASYLSTVAFGEFVTEEYVSASGVPISTWVLARSADKIEGGPERAAEAMDWVVDKLGPYPYDTFGILVVDSESGMETQTMVTLGDTDYATSPEVVVHELVHQWYGDQVTPNDWRDVWMNEGMAMYLQLMWEAEQAGVPIDDQMDAVADFERSERVYAGPPADYDPDKFGSSNIYYGPALMWHELRQQIGDERFFALIKDWPAAQDNRSTGREEFLAFIEKETGEELSAFFDAWLLGETSPSRS
ncbi:MAG: M1 family metallopeptidase, partial [Nocardioides sp.]